MFHEKLSRRVFWGLMSIVVGTLLMVFLQGALIFSHGLIGIGSHSL